jgi:hypothetical protein
MIWLHFYENDSSELSWVNFMRIKIPNLIEVVIVEPKQINPEGKKIPDPLQRLQVQVVAGQRRVGARRHVGRPPHVRQRRRVAHLVENLRILYHES